MPVCGYARVRWCMRARAHAGARSCSARLACLCSWYLPPAQISAERAEHAPLPPGRNATFSARYLDTLLSTYKEGRSTLISDFSTQPQRPKSPNQTARAQVGRPPSAPSTEDQIHTAPGRANFSRPITATTATNSKNVVKCYNVANKTQTTTHASTQKTQ